MKNFEYYNPVDVHFGKDSVEKIAQLIPKDKKILFTYGTDSIKKSRLYEKIKTLLMGHNLVEFGGIESNPDYTTCMTAVEVAKKEGVDFILSVGGGSVLDASKFIAAAIHFEGGDPWELLKNKKSVKVKKAVPIGCVLTLPAAGSEMNGYSVISRRDTKEKLAFGSRYLHPLFSILDPVLTFTLTKEQTANGIVDAFVHVFEQYMTHHGEGPLQDRMSEGIIKTLIEEAPKVMTDPDDYDSRANVMWCATMALNGLIGSGVPQDWTTHMIGHELTAMYGMDHARSLAIILPSVIARQMDSKFEKFVQYGRRVWHITTEDKRVAFRETWQKNTDFLRSLGMLTRFSEQGITNENFDEIAERIVKRGEKLGENKDIGKNEILEILYKSL